MTPEKKKSFSSFPLITLHSSFPFFPLLTHTHCSLPLSFIPPKHCLTRHLPLPLSSTYARIILPFHYNLSIPPRRSPLPDLLIHNLLPFSPFFLTHFSCPLHFSSPSHRPSLPPSKVPPCSLFFISPPPYLLLFTSYPSHSLPSLPLSRLTQCGGRLPFLGQGELQPALCRLRSFPR